MPVHYATWWEMYAFCIWDSGFLPTEAEWNDAAAGGADQRTYPWGTDLSPDNAVYSAPHPSTVGSKSPQGDGKWGQADLAGNMGEWTLDQYESPVLRGGGGCDPSIDQERLTSFRGVYPSTPVGMRCARAP